MTDPSLAAALRAGAAGVYTTEAAAELIIAHGTWLGREDFQQFIHHGRGTAAIDWEAAATAMGAGGLPSSSGEKRMLQLAASLAGRSLVILGDAVTSIDDRSAGFLVKAVLHASGRRQFPASASSSGACSSRPSAGRLFASGLVVMLSR